MLFEGIFRRFIALRNSRGNIDGRMTLNESSAVAQMEANAHDRSRAGRTFILGYSSAVTGIAGVTSLPTTTTQWLLWNGESQVTGRSYYFEELGVYTTSGIPGTGGMLLVAAIQNPMTIGGSNAGISITNLSNGNQKSRMIVTSGVVSTQPAIPNWYSVYQSLDTNITAFPGATGLENRNIQGGIIIPPGQGLGLAVVTPTTTPLFAPFARWYEVESDLE